MKTLKIDDKFSIVYNAQENNRPLYVERNGSRHSNFGTDTPNWVRAMFYTLLEKEENQKLIVEANEKISELQSELSWADETHCYW